MSRRPLVLASLLAALVVPASAHAGVTTLEPTYEVIKEENGSSR